MASSSSSTTQRPIIVDPHVNPPPRPAGKSSVQQQHHLDAIRRTFLNRNLNAHVLQSFDTLVSCHLLEIISLYGRITTLLDGVKYYLKISDLKVMSDQIRPKECFTYGQNLTFAVTGVITMTSSHYEPIAVRTVIARIPLMTGQTILSSPADDYENSVEDAQFGGFFIVRGKPRSIPPTKSPLHNTPLFLDHKSQFVLQVRSSHREKKFRSTSTIEFVIEKVSKRANNCGVIGVKLPFQKVILHVAVLAAAFGVQPEEFNKMIVAFAGKKYDRRRFRSYLTSMRFNNFTSRSTTTDSATILISKIYGKTIKSTGSSILHSECLPHLRDPDPEVERKQKVTYIAYCVSQLILLASGLIEPTDRDAYSNCYFVTGANHLGSVFRTLFTAHIRTTGKLLRRSIMRQNNSPTNIDLVKIFGEPRLSHRVIAAVASGKWSVRRTGVSLAVNSQNRDAISLQVRRISSSLQTTDGTHTSPRNVQADQYGYVCAAFT